MEIRTTEDGSQTLYVPEIEECYHSTYGAVSESLFIFIKDGLKAFVSDAQWIDGSDPQNRNLRVDEHTAAIHVLEIGLGTGLNAFLTLLEAERMKREVCYTSIELFPLAEEVTKQLNYPELLGEKRLLFDEIHRLSWGENHAVSSFFSLRKVQADFTRYELSGAYDVIYFDAFSPEKQPELWDEKLFREIYIHCNDQAVLTTYCAKGAVRRAMQSAVLS